MIELKVGDIVDIKEFRKYDRKAKVTEIGKIRGGYFAGRPFVSAYQSWGDDHAPGSTAGHNFCFMRSFYEKGWIDLDNDTLLDPKYWPYLDNLFGYNKVAEAKTRKLKESIKKTLKEDGRSFGQRFRMGHEVTENASSRLSKIFKTGKIEESSRVVIDFADPEEAKEFKEEMKKRFNYPKTTSRYRVVHGTSESGKNVFVESRGNKKMKGRRFVEANSGFKPLRELLDSLVGPEDYADFLEYASDYGYDFEYEDPNAVWPVAEIQELVDCYYGDEDFGGYFGDPELHTEYDDETGDINLDMAYSDWIKSYAPNYDISNEDAWRAGVELAGGIYDEASGQKYSEWVESFAPNYDISNEDAFTAGFKSIVEDPEITCFESATPYKERGVSYERRGR